MKYLLDSHALLWIAYNEEKLSDRVKNILRDTSAEIVVSAVSIWEINIKYSTGKLILKDKTPADFFDGFDKHFQCDYLDLTASDVTTFYKFNTFHHRDPFDRMMIWQAIQNNLTIITDDEHIHKYTDCGLKVLW